MQRTTSGAPSRDQAVPRQQSSVMQKTEDSSSSVTPTGAAENSVAYQYVAVQQMTTNRDHIEYQLTVREQPKQSRMCGVGEKADRRPIDPAPIVQLRVITHDRPIRQDDTSNGASVAPPVERRPGQGPKTPTTPGVRRGVPVVTALGDGWEDKAWYLENPYYFMYAMLCNAETDEELHLLNDGKTRYTSGSCVSCLYHLKDIDGSHQGFFVFPDLSIRVEGRYRLKLGLFETIGHSVHHCKSIYSDPFHVYTAKRFPGMEESTKLSKSFAEQGLKVRVRKHPRSRRRGSKRTKDESDASDVDGQHGRDRSPKRSRASDVLPVSGLPIPQPSSARLPRSMDARYDRADFDRQPYRGNGPQDLRDPSHHHMNRGWEEEEALRMREARSREAGVDHGLYTRQSREHAIPERLPSSRSYSDARRLSDYSPRHLHAPPHAGMPSRGGPDYPEYSRSAYLREESGRPLLPPPQPSATSPHPPHSRSWADPPPPPAALVSRPPRAHARPYGPPDHVANDPNGPHDDYEIASRRGPRYSAPYDQREQYVSKPSRPSPPSGSVEYGGRSALGHPAPSQWSSRAPSPLRAAEYQPSNMNIDRDFAMGRRSPQPPARGMATPPTGFVSETGAYTRLSYTPAEPGRPHSQYDLDAGRPGHLHPHAAAPRPHMDPYMRDDGMRPSDFAPPDRFGTSGPLSRDRPVLPPLAAPPSRCEGPARESGFPGMARDREPGYGSNSRYLAPAKYMSRGGPPSDAELAELEREREREWEARQRRGVPPAQAQGVSERDEAYGGREWDPRGAQRPSGGPPRLY